MAQLSNTDINAQVKAYLPHLKTLLRFLEAKFPAPTPKPDQTHAEIMYYAGQYSVLVHFQNLVKQAEQENADVLTQSP